MRRALVVGLGAAGLFASRLLAGKGWQVTVVGRGTPMSAMSTGCLRSELGECRQELVRLFRDSDMPMVQAHRTGVSNVGTRFDCWMSPPRSAWVEEDRPTSVSVVGVGRHPSLRPILAASILSGWGPQAEAMAFPLSIPPETSLATVFQDEGRLDELASLLRETRGETVLLPALFSLRDYGSLERLERRCGRRLLEAVTPLGIPGLRFLEVLQTGAMTAGAEIWPGRRVIALSMKGDTVTGAEVTGGLETRRLEVDALLLATGGPLADGLSLTNKGLADPFGLFRLSSPENTEAGGYAHQAGRLVSRSGAKIVNAFGAGNCLATPNRRYGQGLTEALDSAWSATQAMEGP